MTIYTKTPKGMNELLARRPSIDLRLNSMLMLFDGKRCAEEIKYIAETASFPADALETLLYGGYLELKPEEQAGLAQPAPAAQTAAATHAAKTTALPGSPAFPQLYQYMVKETKTLLGLRGFGLQLQIEKAQSLGALKAIFGPLSEAVAKRHGLEIAKLFMLNAEKLAAA
jgi:hypothetical protein